MFVSRVMKKPSMAGSPRFTGLMRESCNSDCGNSTPATGNEVHQESGIRGIDGQSGPRIERCRDEVAAGQESSHRRHAKGASPKTSKHKRPRLVYNTTHVIICPVVEAQDHHAVADRSKKT
jgi:hypothetical protein